ncbi:quercetin 2,3-dioxygenase [Microseira wollei]|uniref:Cupin 2 domain-containing protein n=1 Tax=Microseira wollei NIES-4236 TaxID=2530354 RepID=A0AAV3XMY0_9CYAN|nr:quercetin 2,3-dioxygenase [Microseira wollei]GET43668.1 cupin 2 domain-containing protein [Microseira wollei NIES-4236]
MARNQDSILMQPGEGSSSWVLGDLYRFKALSEDTGQTYGLVEIIMQPNSAVPPHIHTRENESFYIQEGEIEFQLGEQTIVATPGTFVHSAKGQPHSFRNIGAKPAKFLCWLTPGGLEKFFIEVGTTVSAENLTPPAVTSADIEKLIATAPKYGLEILPPPA